MSMQTIAAVNAAIKEILIPVLEDANEKRADTFTQVDDGKADEINDRGAFLSILVKDHAVERARGTEGGAFPPASGPVYVKATLPHITIERTVGMSGAVKRNSNRNQINVNVVKKNFTNAMDKYYKARNRAMFGDGSGELARAGAGSVGAGGTAVDTTTKIITCNGLTNLFGSRFIDEGQELEARSSSGTSRDSGSGTAIKMTVTAVDRGNKKFTVDQLPTDLAASDVFYNYGSYGKDIYGFDYHIAKTGTWLGLTRGSSNIGLNSVRRSQGGEKLTGGALDQLIGDVTFKLGGEPDKEGAEIIWAPTQENSYKDEGYELKQFVMTVGQTARGANIDMSFSGVTHSGIKTRKEVDCQIDRVIYNRKGAMGKFALQNIQILQDDGGPLRLQVGADGYMDAYVGFIQGVLNVAPERPQELAMLTDCAYTGYSDGSIA
jgi:hypothetical protein